ncbi:MAG: hypothetical protein IJJ82_05210 [Clostridia bacterium]|nr:hypothetical protein [Clostridia bacterium]
MEKLVLKVNLRKVNSEKTPEIKGFADLTIGDVVVRDVAVKVRDTSDGQKLIFDMPLSRTYETNEGEKRYVKAVELYSTDEKIRESLVYDIKTVLSEALEKKEANEFNRYTAELITDIEYDNGRINSKVYPVETNDNSLRGFSNLLYGNIIKFNDIVVKEFVRQEDGKPFIAIQFPQKTIEKENEKEYIDKVFPSAQGLRERFRQSIEEAYVEALETQMSSNDIDDEEMSI